VQDIAYTYVASVHEGHERSPGTAAAAFLIKFCSQLGIDLDCWELDKYAQVYEMAAGVQKAGCLTSSVSGALSLWKVKNSPEISRMTGDSTSRQYVCSASTNTSAARFVNKDYRHTTSVTGLLDELRWLPLFERHKHSRLTVFITRQYADTRY